MTTPNARPVRAAVGLGVSLAVVASGLAVIAAPAAQAGTVGAPRAAVAHPTTVQAGVVNPLAAPAGSSGQGPLASSCTSSGGRTSCDIWAKAGAVSVHTSATATAAIPVWDFVGSASAAATGADALLVGTAGEPMDITVHNDLASSLNQKVGLSVPAVDGFHGDHVGVASGASKTYTFTPDRAGSYVYQAGLTSDGSRQVAMGLAGALIVRPAAGSATDYDTAQSTFDDEAAMVYADVDANLAADPIGFNMRDYNPQFHLLNGVAYPDGTPITTSPGRTLMLRFVNTSIVEKSPTILGTQMTVFARGARPTVNPMTVAGRLVDPGDTIDASITLPAGAHRYSIYDAPGLVNNGNWVDGVNSQAIGGGMTFIQSGGTGTVAPTGPAVIAFTAANQPGGLGRNLSLSATLNTANRGGGTIAEAEYYVDTLNPTPGTGTALTGLPAGLTALTTVWPLDSSLLTSGNHTLWVRGRDSFGAWGPLGTVQVRIDNNGPIVTGAVLGATTTNGAAALTVSATANDTTTGGSTSTAARYWIDGTNVAPVNAVALATNGPRIVAAISGSVPAASIAALAEGTHTVWIQAKDVLGQWGVPTAAMFQVDKTVPLTSSVAVKPGYTNGITTNPAKPGSFQISATITDPLSGGVSSPVVTVEAYLESVGAAGATNAISLTNAGGSTWIGDMPLAWIGGYKTSYALPICVVGTDAAGNRNASTNGNCGTLIIDKSAPVTTGSITQVANAATATLNVTAADATPTSGIARAEYFIGTDPGVGLATAVPVTGTTGTAMLNLNALNLTAGQTITVYVRSQDNAGNWSTAVAVTKALTPVVFFADGFDTTTTPYLPGAWTSQTVSGTGAALTTTATGALAGGRSLIATMTTSTPTSGAAYVSHNMSALSPALGAKFSAHFSFAPGTTATGTTAATNVAGSASAVTVFSGVVVSTGTSNGANAVQVQYSRIGTTVRFRVGVPTGNASANPTITWSSWTTATAASNYAVSVDYTSAATGGGAVLKVNGTTLGTVTGNTSNYQVGLARLGVIYHSTSGTAISMLFDSYSAARAAF